MDNVGNRYKQIYLDLEDGTWYVTDETSDSNLRGLRVEVLTESSSWYVKHYRRTDKVFFQILDSKMSICFHSF